MMRRIARNVDRWIVIFVKCVATHLFGMRVIMRIVADVSASLPRWLSCSPYFATSTVSEH